MARSSTTGTGEGDSNKSKPGWPGREGGQTREGQDAEEQDWAGRGRTWGSGGAGLQVPEHTLAAGRPEPPHLGAGSGCEEGVGEGRGREVKGEAGPP